MDQVGGAFFQNPAILQIRAKGPVEGGESIRRAQHRETSPATARKVAGF
jgi:hypothetical protein